MDAVRRGLVVGVGGLACGVALLLGGAWWSLVAGAALFVAGGFAGPRVGVASLLAAPVVVSVGVGVETFASQQALVGAVLAIVSAVPVFVRLGGAVPWRGGVVVVGGVFAVLVLLVWAPFGPSLFASDIAPRAQVVLVAAAALVVSSLLGAWAKRRSGA